MPNAERRTPQPQLMQVWGAKKWHIWDLDWCASHILIVIGAGPALRIIPRCCVEAMSDRYDGEIGPPSEVFTTPRLSWSWTLALARLVP